MLMAWISTFLLASGCVVLGSEGRWGPSAIPGGSLRRTMREEVELSDSVQAESTRSRSTAGGKLSNTWRLAIMSSYGEVAATGNPSGRAMSLLHAGNRAVHEDSREKDQVRVSNLLNDS